MPFQDTHADKGRWVGSEFKVSEAQCSCSSAGIVDWDNYTHLHKDHQTKPVLEMNATVSSRYLRSVERVAFPEGGNWSQINRHLYITPAPIGDAFS